MIMQKIQQIAAEKIEGDPHQFFLARRSEWEILGFLKKTFKILQIYWRKYTLAKFLLEILSTVFLAKRLLAFLGRS